MLPRPSAESTDDAGAKQRREMVSFGEDREIDWGAEPSDNVGNRIGVAIQCRNICTRMDHWLPNETCTTPVGRFSIELVSTLRG
jgi:hypothetical protein